MKKVFTITLFIIFTLSCSKQNTYSSLKIYPCNSEIYAYISQTDDHAYISILYLTDGTELKLDNEEAYRKGVYDIVDEDATKSNITLPIPNSLQTVAEKYRSTTCSTLYIKGSAQEMNELQKYLETFDFHIVAVGDTSFDILGRVDSEIVILPIQKF